MTLETISEQRCFGGVQGFYQHQSAKTATAMRFAVYVPPAAGSALLDDITVDGSINFGTSAIDITGTHEGILLTGLADADLVASGFAALLSTLNGILSTAGAGTDALIVAQGVNDTGFYVYQEAGGDDTAATSELTLLAIAENEIVATTDVAITGGV